MNIQAKIVAFISGGALLFALAFAVPAVAAANFGGFGHHWYWHHNDNGDNDCEWVQDGAWQGFHRGDSFHWGDWQAFDDSDCTTPSTTGGLVVIKNFASGAIAFDQFSFDINGLSTTTFDPSGENDFSGMAAGPYVITEAATTTYTPGYSAGCTAGIVAGATTTCTITNTLVPAANIPPVADNQNLTTDENVQLSITLTGSDADNGPNPLVFATSSDPLSGTVDGTAPDLTYTPDSGFTGPDSFTFTAGDGLATSTATVSITVNVPADTTPTTDTSSSDNGGGGGGGGGGWGGGCSTYSSDSTPWWGTIPCATTPTAIGGGLVLGESTGPSTGPSCSALISSYMGLGKKNNTNDVKALQIFLNAQMNAGLTVNGIFDAATMQAVKAFQLAHWQDVLLPWKSFGLGDHDATGYVYKTTLRLINNLNCSSLNIPLPQLP